MIVVAENLEKDLDTIWYRLQKVIIREHQGTGISQIDLDTLSVDRLARFVTRLENKGS